MVKLLISLTVSSSKNGSTCDRIVIRHSNSNKGLFSKGILFSGHPVYHSQASPALATVLKNRYATRTYFFNMAAKFLIGSTDSWGEGTVESWTPTFFQNGKS